MISGWCWNSISTLFSFLIVYTLLNHEPKTCFPSCCYVEYILDQLGCIAGHWKKCTKQLQAVLVREWQRWFQYMCAFGAVDKFQWCSGRWRFQVNRSATIRIFYWRLLLVAINELLHIEAMLCLCDFLKYYVELHSKSLVNSFFLDFMF